MAILRIVTIAYAVVLTLALAISLVLILVHLMRIRARLKEIRAALVIVAQRTEPLPSLIEPLYHAIMGAAGDWREAERALNDAQRGDEQQEQALAG